MDAKLEPIALGKAGEQKAAEFLEHCGYQIIARNYRCCFGEIDIIAKEAGTICFIEVKTRRSHRCGSPAESVTAHKRLQISRSAVSYLKTHKLLSHSSRFDVVQVSDSINVIRNAFEIANLF